MGYIGLSGRQPLEMGVAVNVLNKQIADRQKVVVLYFGGLAGTNNLSP